MLLSDCASAEVDQGGDRVVRVASIGSGGQRAEHRLADGADQRGRGDLDVLLGQLAGANALLEDLGDHVAIAVTEVKSFGFDSRVDRLGEQRPRETASGERATSEGLSADGDALPGGAGGRGGRTLAHGVDLPLRGLAEDLGEE